MKFVIPMAIVAVLAATATSAQANDKIRCGNGVYKEAMKNKRVLLKGKDVRCINYTYRGRDGKARSAVLNWTQTRCRHWGQSIILLRHNHFLGKVYAAEFSFTSLVVFNTCTGRTDFVVVPPR